MRNQNGLFEQPNTLLIAADCRFVETDYTNDHSWQLFDGGDPVALGIETSYGLRARRMRVFNRINKNNQMYCDPAQFLQPPRIQTAYPNYLSVLYSPFNGVEILNEYWAPSSQSIAGVSHFSIEAYRQSISAWS